MAFDQATIFKAYDVRGIVPDELDADLAYKVGRALVLYLEPEQVAVGHDMRVSGDSLAGAMIDGIRDQGVDVIDVGLVSSDALYFAVGKYGYDAGVMITASHNPPAYNGFKICKRKPARSRWTTASIRSATSRSAASFPNQPSGATSSRKKCSLPT
ncbi:MAG: hypothetical protein R2848_03200 [Thermomicrobiales bacterium]